MEISDDEKQRIVDCVNGCAGLGNPLALPDLIIAVGELIEALEAGRQIGMDDAEAQSLMDAVAMLEPTPPPHEDN